MKHLSLSLLFTWASVAQAAVVDRVAAVVDDDVITLTDIYDLDAEYVRTSCVGATDLDTCSAKAELELLDALIDRSLLEAELRRLGLDVGRAEIDGTIDLIMQENNIEDRATLRKLIEQQGDDWESYRAAVGEQLRVQQFHQYVLMPRVSVREDELLDQYQRAVRAMPAPLSAEVEAMAYRLPEGLTEAAQQSLLAEFQAVAEAVNAGSTTWEAVVAEHDTAGLADLFPGRRFQRGELAAELEPAVFEAPLGAVAAPVLASNMIYLVRPVDRAELPADVPAFDEVRAQLEQQVAQSQMADAQAEWLQAARRRAAIDIKLHPALQATR